ncbi:hypothetical protein [Paraburkholderia acidisoli]|uniref:Uncharacterized protein n=1 Tax=Paraburkholderia acidisoli TaxID=2571748 RepID=A0A7Z2GMV3_9BURK|nr:hypothetical protein [Paraburkholderia acidisoli]QGZ64722.1 hypothetical protein FAZ98_23105 [Paraburkholderia acidisoli]
MTRIASLVALYLVAAFTALAPRPGAARDPGVLEYGAQCAKEIGAIPAFNCNDGTDIPITVDGKPPAPGTAPKQCDRPSLLSPLSPTEGQCTPYSKILNLTRGNIQISAYCRRNVLRDRTDPHYDEVIVVLHHADNGKTCWFDSQPPPDSGGWNATRVPPPNEATPPRGRPSAVEFWATPAKIAANKPTCIECHDAGPFIFSPYIGQVWDKVPTDPWGKYSNLGAAFASYHLKTMSTPGNTCIGCHRIGSEQSCTVFLRLSAGRKAAPGNDALANRYPLSHWMPTDNTMSEAQWNAANVKSVDDLLACCNDKNHPNPNCTFTPMPPGGTVR